MINKQTLMVIIIIYINSTKYYKTVNNFLNVYYYNIYMYIINIYI